MEPTELVIWALLEQAKSCLQESEQPEQLDANTEDARILVAAAQTLLVDSANIFGAIERRS